MRDRSGAPVDPRAELARLPEPAQQAATARLRTLAGTLAQDAGSGDVGQRLQAAVDGGRHDLVWLCLAVLHGRLPDEQAVLEAWRHADLEGASALLARELRSLAHAVALPDVEVVRERVVVDVDRTAKFDTATGIQRVVRELVSRWAADRDCDLLAWWGEHTGVQRLSQLQHDRATATVRVPATHLPDEDQRRPAVVPWRCTWVLPELSVEAPRNDRLRALARFASNRLVVLGHDCIAIGSAETTDNGVAGDVAWYLSAVKHAAVVAATSRASTQEFRGFRAMLSAQGLAGPEVVEVPLPAESRPVTAEEMEAGRLAIGAGHWPLVLCIGSHEPRKNHLAVLQAAELLWRRGERFFLTFIGGAGWRGAEFDAQVEAAQRAGRPVHVVRRADEGELWAAYRLARLVVFPSLHEGFGLPVAEALAVGTPVVTSRFGSMQELAEDGGALLVDPHNDHELAEAVGRLITDDALHRQLVDAAVARPARSWDDYARELWAVAVSGGPASE